MIDFSGLLFRVLFDLSQMLQTFTGPLELGLLVGGLLGVTFPRLGKSVRRWEMGVIGAIVFVGLPVSLLLGLLFVPGVFCDRPHTGPLDDLLYDYLIILSLTAAFGVGRVIRGEYLALGLTALAILFGGVWFVMSFLFLGVCGEVL